MLQFYKTKALFHTWSPWILGWPEPPPCTGSGLGFQEFSAAPAVGLGTGLQTWTSSGIHYRKSVLL